MKPLDFEKFLQRAKSAAYIAAVLGVHQVTVEGWREAGIPEKHWRSLIEEFRFNATELHELNESIRGQNAKS